MVRGIGAELAEQVRDATLRLYTFAADYALRRGIILADTKFEFGTDADGRLYVMDEMLTPDSSRYWRSEEHTSELQSLMRISYAVFCLIKIIKQVDSSYILPSRVRSMCIA